MKPPKNFDDEQSRSYNRKPWEENSSDTNPAGDDQGAYQKPSYLGGTKKPWQANPEQEEGSADYDNRPSYHKKPSYGQEGGGYDKPYYKKPYDNQGGYNNPQGGGYYKKPYDNQGGGYNKPSYGGGQQGGGYDKPYYKKPYDNQGGGYNKPSYGSGQQGGGGYDKPYYKKPYDNQGGGYNKPSYGSGQQGGGGYDKPYYKKPYDNQGGGYNKPSYGAQPNDYDSKFNKKTWNDNSSGFPDDSEERPSYNPKKVFTRKPWEEENNTSGSGYPNQGPPQQDYYRKPTHNPGGYQKRPYQQQGPPQYQNRYQGPPQQGGGGYGYGGGYQQPNRGGYGYPPQQNRGGGGYQKPGGNRYPQPNRGPGNNRYPQQNPYEQREPRYREKPPIPDYPTNDFTGEMRLNKYIAHAGICARRKADDLIKDGKVLVNDVVITEMGFRVKEGDVVKVNSELITPKRKYVYVLLNKPHNVITTAEDEKGRRTVLEFVREITDERIYPVGRLDRNTTGLLLLTNDGELAQKLSHPSHGVRKVYQAVLDRPISPEDIEKIRNTLTLEDGEAPVDAVDYVEDMPPTNVGIELHIGKNHIVRRIFEHLGYQVKKLDRVRYAMLTKKGLRRGDTRFLTAEEVIYLKHLTDSQ